MASTISIGVRISAILFAVLILIGPAGFIPGTLQSDADLGAAVLTAAPSEATATYGLGSSLEASGHVCWADGSGDGLVGPGDQVYLTAAACTSTSASTSASTSTSAVTVGDLRLAPVRSSDASGNELTHPFGSTVQANDTDLDTDIRPLPGRYQTLTLDRQADGQHDALEPLYLAPTDRPTGTGTGIDTTNLTGALRLGFHRTNEPGTFVEPGDDEANTTTEALEVQTQLAARDLNGNGTIEHGEPIYVLVAGEARAVLQEGDLRLLPAGPRPAGSSVLDARPLVATAYALVLTPFLVLFTWIGAFPDHASPTLKRRVGVDLSKGGQAVGLFIHLIFLFFVFGNTIISTAQGFWLLQSGGGHPAQGVALSDAGLVASLVANLIFFVAAAVTWLMLVDGEGMRGVVRSLRLDIGKLPRGVAWGIGAVIAVFAAQILLGFILQQVGYVADNPQADAIAGALAARPWLAVVVAALAGLGEEIYFRGFLLERTGNFWQAALFGALHATYLTPFQVILPFALGLFFGYLTRKTSLWAPITAHTAFNAIALWVAIEGPELAAILPG